MLRIFKATLIFWQGVLILGSKIVPREYFFQFLHKNSHTPITGSGAAVVNLLLFHVSFVCLQCLLAPK